jgi:hypothetical protein
MSIQPSSASPISSKTSPASTIIYISALTTITGLVAYQIFQWVCSWNEKGALDLYSQQLNTWIEIEKKSHKIENEATAWENTIRDRVGPKREGQTVNLSKLKLTTLPPIWKPEKILILDASDNEFMKTPRIEEFRNLTKLSLAKSSLKIPPNLYPLKDLKTVNLSGNLLTKIPYTDPNHPEIFIDLSYNLIEEVTLSILNKSVNYTLILNKNPLSNRSLNQINKHKKDTPEGPKIIYDPTLSTPRVFQGAPLSSCTPSPKLPKENESPPSRFYTPTSSSADLLILASRCN